MQWHGVSLAVPGRTLIEPSDLALPPGSRVGVVGDNGCGKSTLFKAIAGEHPWEAGRVVYPKHWRCVRVAQWLTQAKACSVIECVCHHDARWTRMMALQDTANIAQTAQAWDAFHAYKDQVQGASLRQQAESILQGLGFSQDALQRPVTDFSGGWQMRIQLAKALFAPSEILLLDEPTNHLDMSAIIWLESWLKSSQSLILFVSHDHAFLDHVSTHILSLAHQRLTLVPGHYSHFLKHEAHTKKVALRQQQKEAEKRKVDEAFVTRFRAKATKAKQVQSRIKQMEKAPATVIEKTAEYPSLVFQEAHALQGEVIRLTGDLSYGSSCTLQSVNCVIEAGNRLAILGENGAGKTTLLRALMGEGPLLSGHYHCHPNASLAYVSQHHLQDLPETSSAIAWCMQQTDMTERDSRHYLASYCFTQQRVYDPIRLLSGGERVRLALALVMYKKPNILMLDEPTNHLDLRMRARLIQALQAYPGTVVMISHDRQFLQACAQHAWWVHQGRVSPLKTDIATWLSRVDQPEQAVSQPPTGPKSRVSHQALKRLERAIERAIAHKKTLEDALASSDLGYQGDALVKRKKIHAEYQEACQTLDHLEQSWLEAQDE